MADFDVDVTMTGLEEITKRLEGVKYDIQKKGGRFALRRAAQVLRDAARSRAKEIDDPSTPDNIAANIVERWSNSYNKRTGDLMFRVGVLGGSQATHEVTSKRGKVSTKGTDVFYWRFLEFGTEKMAARPFFRPGVESSLQRATNVFMKELDAAIGRAIKKAGG